MPSAIHTDQDRVEGIRRLGSSTFNYWFGYVANLSLVVWLVSYAWHSGHLVLDRAWFVFLALIGLFSWTLSEYLLHRYVYHELRSFLSLGHALHHESPQALIGIPWYLTTMILIAAFALLALPFRTTIVG
jgi:hypothetical protein